jgi:hypothetical protein
MPKKRIPPVALASAAILLLAILGGLAMSGWFSTKSGALSTVKRVGPEKLRDEAKALGAQLRSYDYPYGEVPQKMWPESFRALAPVEVINDPLGNFRIVRYQLFRQSDHLLVVPAGSGKDIDLGKKQFLRPGVSCEKITDGIFWFSIR